MWALLLCIVLVLSCEKQEGQKAQRPLTITTHTLSATDLQLYYETKGYLESFKDVLLRPDVSGRVAEVYVEEGSFVKQGQALLRLDASEHENTLKQLQAQMAQVRVNYENQRALVDRRRALLEQELIAREEYENALAQLRAQEELINSINSQIANAKLQVSKTTLRAPFSGYIAQRLVNVGDYLTTQSQTFRLVTLNPLRVVFQVPQELVSFTRLGAVVHVGVEGAGSFKGDIILVSPVADQNRLITIKARLENRDGVLKPGMFAVVSLPTERVSLYAIPERALVLRGAKKIVWKVEGEGVVPVEAEVLKQEKGTAYIKAGLKEGDRIALDNAPVLREGIKVEIKH